MALTETVSARVRDELKAQNVSHRELARRLGVSQAYISRRLSDQPEVHFRTNEIEKVAEVLGVPVERFVTDAPTTPAGAA